MDKQELYKIEEKLLEDVRRLEAEQKKYIDGIKKGIDMTVNSVRDFINNEEGK